MLKKICDFIDWLANIIVNEQPIEQRSQTILHIGPSKEFIPTNYIETSIKTIADAGVSSTSNYTKEVSAKKIVEVLASTWKEVTGNTKSYAIRQLGRLQKASTSTYTKECISNYITMIATGHIQK